MKFQVAIAESVFTCADRFLMFICFIISVLVCVCVSFHFYSICIRIPLDIRLLFFFQPTVSPTSDFVFHFHFFFKKEKRFNPEKLYIFSCFVSPAHHFVQCNTIFFYKPSLDNIAFNSRKKRWAFWSFILYFLFFNDNNNNSNYDCCCSAAAVSGCIKY